MPYCTAFISILTLVYSFYVAYDISGSLFGKVRIVQVEPHGAVALSHIRNFEFWRLFTSQIIHIKQLHMLYNVISLFAVGAYIERRFGIAPWLCIWFLSGAAGTFTKKETGNPDRRVLIGRIHPEGDNR